MTFGWDAMVLQHPLGVISSLGASNHLFSKLISKNVVFTKILQEIVLPKKYFNFLSINRWRHCSFILSSLLRSQNSIC